MADNENRGGARLPDETIIAFVSEKAFQVEGVHDMGNKKPRGVRISYDEENGYTIDIFLIAAFGSNIPETAWNVQKCVYDGLKNEFDIVPEDINIHIQGVYAS